MPCFLSAKPAGAVRIFVLGSSAAQGMPDPSFSVGRILEVLLRERYPDVKFEVVNAAMTAINSHVALEIARDCAAHQPDLFVVYMGNNEVVGPYGPGTVFQQWSPSLRFIRANVWLKSTRTRAVAWRRDRVARILARAAPTAWQGMEMFMGNQVAADDPRLPAVYDNFRQNLIDICGIARAGRGRGGPFDGGREPQGLPAVCLAAPIRLVGRGFDEVEVALSGRRRTGEQRRSGRKRLPSMRRRRGSTTVSRNSRSAAAAVWRRWAGRQEAREQFVAARDLDALRFRADSRINAIIREVAAEQEAAGVRLADAEQSLANSDLAVGGIPGEGLFYEHVHFTFDGNYLLARAVAGRG